MPSLPVVQVTTAVEESAKAEQKLNQWMNAGNIKINLEKNRYA